jgi:hypothetical protein
MARYYVNITGIPDDFLEFMGYTKVAENDDFELRVFKDETYIINKNGPRFLYVEDPDDAAILRGRAKVAAPPKPKVPKPRKPPKRKPPRRRR